MSFLVLAILSLFFTQTDAQTSSESVAPSVKVIFQKNFFYNNNSPYNGIGGCAGDAQTYFDPQTDRSRAGKPSWLTNVAVELTNANAPFGASLSYLCSYGSTSSTTPSVAPAPSNCAAFDDSQPLTGSQTPFYLLGGFTCEATSAGRNCDASSNGTVSTSVWKVQINPTNSLTPSSSITMSKPSFSLPLATSSVDTSTSQIHGVATGALAQMAWAFDSIHEWGLGFGGVDSSGNLSDALMRIALKPYPGSFNDGTVRAHNIEVKQSLVKVLQPGSGSVGLNGTTATNLNMGSPWPRVGHSFTYIPRRTPSLARRYLQDPSASPCPSGQVCLNKSVPSSNTDTSSGWNDSDYVLLMGGVSAAGVATPNTAQLSSAVAALVPHRISEADSTGTNPAIDAMTWEWLDHYNGTSSKELMKVIDLSLDGSVPSSWEHQDRFGSRSACTGKFPGRAFHRSVYDPIMNRVYTFGGIVSTDGSSSTTENAYDHSVCGILGSGAISATNETWIYDPPQLERAPSQGCQTSYSPAVLATSGSSQLPGLFESLLNTTVFTKLIDHSSFSISDLAYEQSDKVFPPGGCLQYAQPVTNQSNDDSALSADTGTGQNYIQPTPRFEHAMAFDEAQGSVVLFGGCKTPPTFDSINGFKGTITSSTSTSLGTSTWPLPYDPLANCSNRNSLLNDTWLYLPPKTIESAEQSTVSRPDYLSGLDPLYHGLPAVLESGSSTPSTLELQGLSHGVWIKLFSDDAPSTSLRSDLPSPRASSSFWYDRSHQKFYLMGGKQCQSGGCQTLSDLWEFTPPSVSTCSRLTATCLTTGTWRQIVAQPSNVYSRDPSHASVMWPSTFRSTAVIPGNRPPGDYYSYQDGYYTISDQACSGQGTFLGTSSSSKEQVGAIYIDIDRSQFTAKENLLLNLKLLPYGDGTKLPGYHFNGTYSSYTNDDRDSASDEDTAYLRVSLMINPIISLDRLLYVKQPRMRTYQAPGSTLVVKELDLAVSGTGQPTEKQILIPLSLDSRINMIKIERVRGTVKYYDMTLSRF